MKVADRHDLPFFAAGSLSLAAADNSTPKSGMFFSTSVSSLGSRGGLRPPSDPPGVIPGEFRLRASTRCSPRRSSYPRSG